MCECILRFDPARLLWSIAAVLEVGCRLLLIAGCRETLRLRGDARGVQRASEAPDGQTTTYTGTMPVAFCAKTEIARNRFS